MSCTASTFPIPGAIIVQHRSSVCFVQITPDIYACASPSPLLIPTSGTCAKHNPEPGPAGHCLCCSMIAFFALKRKIAQGEGVCGVQGGGYSSALCPSKIILDLYPSSLHTTLCSPALPDSWCYVVGSAQNFLCTIVLGGRSLRQCTNVAREYLVFARVPS